jgi:hypothetical protein
LRVTVRKSHPGVSAVKLFSVAAAGSEQLLFLVLGKRQFYFIEFFDAFTPLSERVVCMESGFYGFGFNPFVEQSGPQLQIVGPEFFDGCSVAEFGRNVTFVVTHQSHAHAQKAPGHTEVGVLFIGATSAVIFF